MARQEAAILLALCAWQAASFSQECWSMGETCGDDARCSGMGTHCGDRSECSGSSTTCGANSVCSGIDSVCGPGSQCSGLGAKCAGGPAQASGGQWQQQSDSDDDDSWDWKPMKWKKEQPPAHVYVHGCDQGEVCGSRPGASQSSGVTVCCKAGCEDCSASSSQNNDVLTATCVCNDPEPTAAPVNAKGCETGAVCSGRPGAAEADGMAFCCPAYCAECDVYGQEGDGVLTAMCVCGGQRLAETPGAVPAVDDGPEQLPPFVAVFLAAFAGASTVFAATMVGRRRAEVRQPLLLA